MCRFSEIDKSAKSLHPTMGGGGRGWGVGFCIVYAGCGYQEVEGIRGGV